MLFERRISNKETSFVSSFSDFIALLVVEPAIRQINSGVHGILRYLRLFFLAQNISSSSSLFSFTSEYWTLLGNAVDVLGTEVGAGVFGRRRARTGEAGVGGLARSSHTVFLILAGAIFVQNNCLIGTLGMSSGSKENC